MKGLELSRAYFESYGLPMLEEQFSEVMPFLSAGLVGSGSEVLGYDDEISEDHDFEPGFCLLLPREDIIDRRTAFLLERAYAKLPKEFMGYHRSMIGPVGGARHGVLRMDEFFREKALVQHQLLNRDQDLFAPVGIIRNASQSGHEAAFPGQYGACGQSTHPYSLIPVHA